jgi:hypothetical protein
MAEEVNAITVKVLQPGKPTSEYCVLEGQTAKDVLKAAGVDVTKLQGGSIKINRRPATLDTKVEHTDVISVTGKIAGGC